MPVPQARRWAIKAATAKIAPVAFAYIGKANSTSDLTTYTFAAQGIGTASPKRLVVVAIHARRSSNRTISAVTIGGIAAAIVQSASSHLPNGFAFAIVPTGTTADIVITFSADVTRCAIGVATLASYRNVAPVTVATNIATSTLNNRIVDIPDGAIALSAFSTEGTSACTTTGATELQDDTIEAASQFCFAQYQPAGNVAEAAHTIQHSVGASVANAICVALWR